MKDNLKITWKQNNTEVYVNNLYAGYIDNINSMTGAWIGRCYYTNEDGVSTMQSFGVKYDKEDIRNCIVDFIRENADSVIRATVHINKLNK